MHHHKPSWMPLIAIAAALGTSLAYAQEVVPAAQEAVEVVPEPVVNEPRMVAITAAPAPSAGVAAATLFEENGILTPKDAIVVEPSLQYVYASSNRVAIVGYTVIPALLLGLLDVREVKNNTLTGAVTTRVGFGKRWDMEVRVPYVVRRDTTVSRQIGQGADADSAFDAGGQGIGDVEFAGRYQLTDGGRDGLYLVAGLRLKLHNGKDPFEVVTDCNIACNGSSTGLQLEEPTGSGFYSLQPSLTWLLPSDPAVFFGGISYAHNFKRDSVSRQILNGQTELIGDIEPGGVFGINFGMGLTLNEKSSFSIGFDLNSVGPTRVDGTVLSSSVRTQLASLLLGYSYRYSPKRTINLTVSAGLTRDTPDLTVNLKMPFTL